MLSPEQVQAWHRDGYLVLPGFKPAAERDALVQRAREIVDAFDPTAAGVFSTVRPERLADEALLASAAQVHCFLEEEAFDASGALKQPKALSINKIGHAMHDLDPVFGSFSRDPRLAAIAADIGMADPRLWQSMVIFKQPSIGGEVRWHQDATFLVTKPGTTPRAGLHPARPPWGSSKVAEPHLLGSVVAFWFALEDATLDNGCLWVQPGGHRGPLRERFGREAPGSRTLRMEKLDATPWPDTSSAVPVEVEAGALVMFDGLLPHYSAPNRSPISRMAYTLHVVDGSAAWSPLNWLQRGPELPVRGF
jgi:phytanoyl-CoA hydroxylase